LQFRKRRLQELLQLRKKEEIELKKAGHKNYKEIAEGNYKVALILMEWEHRYYPPKII
jgi:hypothetical protein